MLSGLPAGSGGFTAGQRCFCTELLLGWDLKVFFSVVSPMSFFLQLMIHLFSLPLRLSLLLFFYILVCRLSCGVGGVRGCSVIFLLR
jgi:hypothetical protein